MALFETVGGKQNRRAFEKHDNGNRCSTLIAFVESYHLNCDMYVKLVSTEITNKRVLQTR